MPVPENMTIKIIHSDVWTFWESDISLAHAASAMIFWFNVPIPASIIKKADQMKLKIKTYDIIYEMVDYIDGVLKWMIKIEVKEVGIWRLTILGVFFKKEKEMIIGGKVTEWETRNGAEFRVWRKWESGEDEIIGQGRITSLKRDQENVSKVAVWYECGMKVRVSKKVVEGDTLEFFVME
jgi:translation initiation factor IF-2